MPILFPVKTVQKLGRQTVAHDPKARGLRLVLGCRVALKDDECIESNGRHGMLSRQGNRVTTTVRRQDAM
jgi:hypothetical protein